MEKVKDVLKEDKLEELLVANWTKFLDSSKVMAFCLRTVRDRIKTLAPVPATELRQRGTQITLSRFQIVADGFIMWVEFTVPIDDKTAVGTTELFLTNTGEISHIHTLGNLYCPNSDNV